MEAIPRNVILDLLPAYIAGEASEETKSLVEDFAKTDTQIASFIRSGNLEEDPISQRLTIPEDLEMKTIKHVRRSIRLQIWYVAFITAAILVAPLIAMQFTAEVNWGPLDFVVMGILLFGTGLTFVLISRVSESFFYHIAVGVAVVAILLLVWMNLAVGIIGSEGNPANLLYAGVVATCIIGAGLSRLRSSGMARTMFTAAFVQMLVPVIVLFLSPSSLEESPGIGGVFVLNAFFSLLFIVSGLLFRKVASMESVL
jgi:hypothetical protein